MNSPYSKVLKAQSAGAKPTMVQPLAIKIMAEMGIDISKQRSEGLEEFEGQEFDYLVMVCSEDAETCPLFPGGRKQILQSFDDPVSVGGTEDERQAFQKSRNEINKWIIDNLVLIDREKA